MILPEDVLDLIRAFSKPRIRFYREFKESLAILGLNDWPKLREKLGSSQAETVLVALLDYRFAHQLIEETKKSYQSSRMIHRFYRIELSKLMIIRYRFKQCLLRIIHG